MLATADKKLLLRELKTLRELFKYQKLDPLIKELGTELIQAECRHLETKTEHGTCFYGTYETTTCTVCGEMIHTENLW